MTPTKPRDRYHRRSLEPEIGNHPTLLTIGKHVRSLRELHGWSQPELGSRCGISQGMISHIERGARDYTVTTLVSLAKALKTNVAALVG